METTAADIWRIVMSWSAMEEDIYKHFINLFFSLSNDKKRKTGHVDQVFFISPLFSAIVSGGYPSAQK